jgi:tRNA A-37 threonylcarbamoyl transferase component Bud32/dipeptidyl aminopeptidase/acylaminoacyl peptidase
MTAVTERLSAALADRYRIERELGQGGMATVYLAEDLKHKRKVAVKVLKPELAAVLGADRFVQEITTTASLQHPHILPLFDSGTADGFLYYVMPFIEGETLRDKLNRETQLGVDEGVRIAREVADALDYAHSKGVIHRDIKPENILIQNGRPMVADFGIALAVSAAAGGRMTETGLSLGTPHYMSPEQATAEKEISARSDVYSLASVLYEMLAGQPPHSGGSAQQIIMKIIAEPVETVTRYRKSVPPNVAAALAKALEKLPADRFDSAKDFGAALASPHFGEGTPAVAGTVRIRSWRWPLAAGLAVGAIGGAIAVLLLRPGEASDANAVALVQRTYARETIYAARWAADAKTILYSSVEDGIPSVRIIRAEYPEPQRFGPDTAHLLAVSSTNEVALLLHAHGPNQRVFTGTLARMSIGGGAPREVVDNVQEADWSPDGSSLAITRNAGDHDQLEYPVGKVIYSSPPGSYVSDPRVSADGERVAFFLHPLRYDDRGFVLFVDTKGTVTRDEEEYAGLEGLAWAADDRSLLFSAASGSPYQIRRWQPGGKSQKVLPSPGRLTMYDVRGGRWLVTRDDLEWLVVAKAPGAGVRNVSWLDGSLVPTLSADGEMIAFGDQGTLSGPLYGVMLRKSDGSPAVRLGDGSPREISPDKKWVIADVPTSPRQFRLYPTGAGAFRPLVWPKLADVTAVGFVLGGKSLYVCGNEPKRASRCYRSSLEAGDVTPLTPDSIVGLPRPDLGAVVAPRDNKWWVYPINGGAPREIPGMTAAPLRWSPDGNALWVFRPGPARQRGVDRLDVVTGRRTPMFTIDELQGVATPFVAQLSIADDGKSYVYFTATYSSLLFSVEGIR